MAKKSSAAVLAGKGKAVGSRVAPAPLTRVSLSDAKGAERSVDVRKIDNGYIVRESVYDPKKGYTSTERFSEKAPTLAVDGKAKAAK